MKATLLAEQIAVANSLDEVQSLYLVKLGDETAGLSPVQVEEFLEDSAEVLSERPPQDWDELTSALSEPKSFAATWRAENAIGP